MPLTLRFLRPFRLQDRALAPLGTRLSASIATAVAAAVTGLLIGTPAHAAPPCLGPHSDTWIYVSVDGVRNANGQIAATVYPDNPDRFLVKNGSLYVVRTPAVTGTTKFCVFLPSTGVYAIAIYHDEDNSGTINRSGVLGVPTEGYGFTNNPPTLASLPTFRSVRLAVPRTNLSTTIHMKYPS
jgi:uncharacterized protein (DUF2141 family)